METNILSISLRDYRKQIDDLKGSLLGLTKGSEDYEKIANKIRAMQENLNNATNIGKKRADALEGSYDALTHKMSTLRQAWKATNDEAERDALGKEIANINAQLKDFDASIGNHQRNVGNYESGTVSLRAQLRELQAQMSEMLANGVSPTSEAFVELAQRAGEIKDAISDTKAVVSNFANDTKGLSNVIDVAKTGAAAFGAWNSAAALLGIENEGTVKSIQKLQGVMTLLNSLQTIQTALVDRASATYRIYSSVLEFVGLKKKANTVATAAETTALGTEATATAADTAAKGAHTVATVAQTVATNALSVALGLLKKALIATGLGAIIVLAGELIAHIDDIIKGIKSACRWITDLVGITKKETEAEKAAAKAAEDKGRVTQLLEDKEKELTNTIAEQQAKYTELQALWNNTKSIEERKRFVEQYKNEMSSLGVEVNNVNDAEKFFSNQGAAMFAKSIQTRAKLVLLQTQLVEAMKAQLSFDDDSNFKGLFNKGIASITNEIVSLQKELNATTQKSSGSTSKTSGSKNNNDYSDIVKPIETEFKKLEEETETYYDKIEAKGQLTATLEIERLKKINAARQESFEKEKEALNNAINNTKLSTESKKKYQDEYENIRQKQIEETNDYEVNLLSLQNKEIKEKYDERLSALDVSLNAEKQAIEQIYTKSYEAAAQALLKGGLSVDEYNTRIEQLETDKQEKLLQITNTYNNERISLNSEYWNEIVSIDGENSALALEIFQSNEQFKTKVLDDELAQRKKAADKAAKEEDKRIKEEKKKQKERKKNQQDFAKSTSSVLGLVADSWDAELQRQVESGEKSQEQAEKEFESIKAVKYAETLINTFAGAAGSYEKTKESTGMWGEVAAWADFGLTLANGLAQAKAIHDTKFGSYGSGSSSSGGGSRTVDFSLTSVNPLLTDNDYLSPTQEANINGEQNLKVYVVESDIAKANAKSNARKADVTF